MSKLYRILFLYTMLGTVYGSIAIYYYTPYLYGILFRMLFAWFTDKKVIPYIKKKIR